MSSTIVLDTDFLSSFLKIDRLSLVREFYQVDRLEIPPAVHQEVSVSTLSGKLARISWVHIVAPSSSQVSPPELARLGAGEQEAIQLSLQEEDSLLLMNDNLARKTAHQLGVRTADAAGFLSACKASGFLSLGQLAAVIRDLREKDFFGFRKEILGLLLAP